MATLSPIELAAQNIVAYLCNVYWIFNSVGMGTSLAIIVGNAIGMRKVSLAKRVMKEMLIMSLMLGMLSSSLFLLF